MNRATFFRRVPVLAFLFAFAVFSSAQTSFRDGAATPEEGISAATDLPASAPADVPRIQLSHEDMGSIYLARQRYQAALAELKQVEKPTAETWNKMGIVYQMLFDDRDAIHCYLESIHRDKHQARVYNNLGTVYDSEKNFKKAEHNYRKALKLDPNSVMALKNLGTNLMRQHRYKDGYAVYNRLLEIEPHAFDTHDGPITRQAARVGDRGAENYYKALSCARAGLDDCALSHLRRAVNEGAVTARRMSEEVSFMRLRNLPGFQQLLSIAK